MDIRKLLNERPVLTTGITLVVIALAVATVVRQALDTPSIQLKKSFYTVDDGATYFADVVERVPPFEHEGKTAFRAYVFRCGKGKPFVAYLGRHTPESQRGLLEHYAQRKGQKPSEEDDESLVRFYRGGYEVKKANDPAAAWVKSNSAKASAVMLPACPSGTSQDLVQVTPE